MDRTRDNSEGALAYQVTIEAEPPAAGRIARALDEADAPQALSVSYFNLGTRRFEISALYDQEPTEDALLALIGAAADGGVVGPLRIDAVADANWVTVSQGKRGKVHAGRFVIHGSHDREHVSRNRFTIEIDAAGAFGTAHHASTRGCLIALDELVKRGRPDFVLDLGTGTGVLAIAAARAFDRPVVATDNDPVAVITASENARKANVAQQVHVLQAEGFAHPALRRIKPDLIFANILARPLFDLAPEMAQCLQPGGLAVLSGLTSAQAQAILARYCGLGFVIEKRVILDDWATLVLGRRSASVLSD
jgi:ribosomal protein L11 methyltransferase